MTDVPIKRRALDTCTGRMQCEDEGRGQGDVSTSQVLLAAIRSQEKVMEWVLLQNLQKEPIVPNNLMLDFWPSDMLEDTLQLFEPHSM